MTERCLFCQGILEATLRRCLQYGRTQPALLPELSLPLVGRNLLMIRQCPFCGEILPASARFCGNCGRSLATQAFPGLAAGQSAAFSTAPSTVAGAQSAPPTVSTASAGAQSEIPTVPTALAGPQGGLPGSSLQTPPRRPSRRWPGRRIRKPKK